MNSKLLLAYLESIFIILYLFEMVNCYAHDEKKSANEILDNRWLSVQPRRKTPSESSDFADFDTQIRESNETTGSGPLGSIIRQRPQITSDGRTVDSEETRMRKLDRGSALTRTKRREPTKPRVVLANRPKGSATTTSTSTVSSNKAEESEEDDSSDGGESDETEKAEEDDSSSSQANQPTSKTSSVKQTSSTSGKQKPKRPISSGTSSSKSKTRGDKKDQDSEEEIEAEDIEQDDEVESTTATPKRKSLRKWKPLIDLKILKKKNESICVREAYLGFPPDLIGNEWRARGLVIIHIAVVCYMFYSLALICDRYFMPSLEEFALRLQLSEDVAGATLMSAGSSAPELFTAILGVFVAKGDVGTGAIVGSAVFNILFVIGVCAFVSSTSTQLNWWPVLRDSVFYTLTVLVLILFIYDERVTALESFLMIALYGVYILIMINNESIKNKVTHLIQSNPNTAKLFSSALSVDGPDDVFGSSSSAGGLQSTSGQTSSKRNAHEMTTLGASSRPKLVEDDSMFLAACILIVRHKRLFRSQLRFRSAALYFMTKNQNRKAKDIAPKSLKVCSDEVNYFGPESEAPQSGQKQRIEAYVRNAALSKNKFSIVSRDDYEFWNRPPEDGENYYIWLAKIPVNYVLHYTVPDCTLYPDKYLVTFFVSILWTAFFSYIMVWMVTLIGYTLGIPDSVMGVTFLAAGTSVPDCYSSIHAARNGMADMAVSNSIGSNVFDILIGLSLPWFIRTAIYPRMVAEINSRGVIYSVVLLFLSLIATIYLMNKYDWTLKPRLGLALLIAYGLFIVLTCMLEFNLFGHVNPPPC